MQPISVFYQAESLSRIEHATFAPESTLGDVLSALRAEHQLDADSVLFLEDSDEPCELTQRLHELAGHKPVKIHVHRCLRIEVAVTFNGTKTHHFAPAATVARVKHWTTEKAFPLTPEEAGEHVLQITGTTERPSPATHLGALAKHPHCHLRFDLVPNERVQGARMAAR